MFGRKRKVKELIFIIYTLPKLKKYILEKLSIKIDKPVMHMTTEIIKKNKKYISKKVENYLDNRATPKEYRKLNKKQLLKKKHLKESNYFVITELGEKTKDFYEAELYSDWTEKNWIFQKESFLESMNDQIKYTLKKEYELLNNKSKKTLEEYTKENKEKYSLENEKKTIERYGETYNELYQYQSWCRWIENKKLVYGAIESLESYIIDEVETKCSSFIEEFIPSVFTSSLDSDFFTFTKTDDETIKDDFIRFEINVKAAGREVELEELKKKIYLFQNKIVSEVKVELEGCFTGMTFKIDNSEDDMTIIRIPDLKTAKQIKTKTFLQDVYERQQPFKIVEQKFDFILKKIDFNKRLKDIYEENKKTK